MDRCIFLAASFLENSLSCVFLWALMQFPTAVAKMSRLPSLQSLAPRMWNDDLCLDKATLSSRTLSLYQNMEPLKFIHGNGLVAWSYSHLELCA